MGGESKTLGETLMAAFLRKLCALKEKPDHVVFYHSAVKLLSQESPVLDPLEILSRAGVDLVACGTCISYYELNNKTGAGRVSDMREIVDLLMHSDSVITI